MIQWRALYDLPTSPYQRCSIEHLNRAKTCMYIFDLSAVIATGIDTIH